jgi:Domain of unknown function(DUF2779)
MTMEAVSDHILSKSTFMYGCQCPKRLWLHKYDVESRDTIDEEQATIFQRGSDVGLLAQQLFPGGINVAPPTPFDYRQSVADTSRCIREGHKVIYEAAFQFDGILCAIDILVNRNGRWFAYEVKSAARVKPPFIRDAALQYYVMTQSGLLLEDIFVTHINRQYIRHGELDLNRLFNSVSVKKDTQELQPFIVARIEELKAVLQLSIAPVIEMGDQCSKPYPCDFRGFCSKDQPEDEPEEAYIDHDAIYEFLDSLRYPLYFMDFETWTTAVPEYDGHWPYRQIPFQFSLHVQERASAEPQHHYYLADQPGNDQLKFAESLLALIGSEGSVIVYNKTFENMILNQLKTEFPQLKASIENVQGRLVDLMSPFRKNYRLPEMKWSYSIKYVLPALAPELDYNALTITNGTDASTAFYNLKNEFDEEKRQAARKALLEYCGLDTFAMVRILSKLQNF